MRKGGRGGTVPGLRSGNLQPPLPYPERPREGKPQMKFRTLTISALLSLLAGCTGVPKGIDPVTGFDVKRYVGTWYEIMRLDHSFERGLTNVTATYALRDGGKVRVVNRGYNPEECAWEDAEGTATFKGDPDVASLSVSFFWPISGGYHVFALDREDYQYAVVSGPSRDYLWILARSPNLPQETLDRLIAAARDNGFPVDKLIRVDHDKPGCAKKP